MLAIIACACVPVFPPSPAPLPPLPSLNTTTVRTRPHRRTRDEVAQAVAAVSKKMPKRIKRKRPITTTDGTPLGGMEEYYDYVFPEEAGVAPNLKLLEAAMRWKRQKLMGAADGGGADGAAAAQGQQPAAAEEGQEEELADADDDGY